MSWRWGRCSRSQPPRPARPAGSTANDVALARAATAKYVTNLALAKQNGYGIITKMIPNMGYHFMNPKVTGFDVTKPPILVYEHHGSSWQLGAVEWVFTKKPATPPLPGATYGAFGAGCHYKDGTFVPAAAQSCLSGEGTRHRRRLQLLAPEPDHDAPLGLVPEPERDLLRHEPARRHLQRRLGALSPQATTGDCPRSWPRRTRQSKPSSSREA